MVEDNYTRIVDDLFGPHPEEWGGAYVEGDMLVVNTVTRSVVEAEQELARIGVTEGVEVRQVEHSMADLDSAAAEIVGAPSTPGNVVVVGPEYSQNRLVVGVDPALQTPGLRSVPKAPDALAAELEADVASIGDIEVAPYETTQGQTTSRYYDTSPYYGGAAINPFGNVNSALCSSAFPWRSDAAGTFMITAAHCHVYVDGSPNFWVSRYERTGASTLIGDFTWSSAGQWGSYAKGSGDFAVYRLRSGTTDARIFTGTYDTTSSTLIKGYTTLPQGWKGSTLRTSGASGKKNLGSGQIAPDWISLTNQTVTYEGGYVTSGLTVAEHNSTCVAKGDSGGAFYQTITSNTAYAVGVISGNNGQGFGTTNCRNYYTPVATIRLHYGGTVKVG